MGTDQAAEIQDETRLAEIEYHRKQNRAVIYLTLPSMLLYAGFYYYLSSFLQVFFFVLMITNSVSGLIIGNLLKDLHSLTIYKRIAGVIWFAFFAANLLTGLWDANIYYVVLPWVFLYPVAAIMFLSRRLGFIVGATFCILALIFFLISEFPPLDGRNVRLLQINIVFTLLSILLVVVIYEKMRMRVQDDLAVSKNQYRLAEQNQRETNVELQQEIEKRRQTENALQKSELHYRVLFEESIVPLWEEDWSGAKIILDRLPGEKRRELPRYFEQNPQIVETLLDGIRISAVNRATLKLFQTDSVSFPMESMRKFIATDDPGIILRRIISIEQTGRYSAELTGTTLKGEKRHLLVSSVIPAGYKNTWEKIFSSVYDITERITGEQEKKRVEERMQNARQIQAIATLAGGIAHQFNNALAVIFGGLDLLAMNAQEHPANLKYLKSLKVSAGRMSRLTDQLLAYAEGGKYQPQPFSINNLMNNIINSKIVMRESSIQLIVRLSDKKLIATGDITQIEMVVDVVLSNSFEALQQGGEVIIATGLRCMESAESANDQPIKAGSYIFISIEDNGVGMKIETLQRIFEPFFTTKIYGRGLGMAAAFGIVRNHDGIITVDSEPGKGTRVVIYLPACENSDQHLQQLSLS